MACCGFLVETRQSACVLVVMALDDWVKPQAGRISIIGVYAGFTNNFNIGVARLPWPHGYSMASPPLSM